MAPTGLSTLAPELVQHVVKKAFELDSDYAEIGSRVWSDVLSLASTCRYLRNVVTPIVYRLDGENNSSALILSTKRNNISAMTMALSCGADVHARDRATALWGPFDELLGRRPFTPLKVADQATPLHWAAIKGHVEAMQLLLQHEDINVNHRESIIREILEEGANPLYFAVATGNVQIARLLIEAGSSFTTHLGTDVSALHQACRNGDIPMVQLMLGHVHPDTRDAKGRAPMHCLPDDPQLVQDMVNLLVDSGANINARDGEGGIPIHTYFLTHLRSWCPNIAAIFIRRGSLVFDHLYRTFGTQWPSCRSIILEAIDDAKASGFTYNEEAPNDVPMFHERYRHINLWFYKRYTGLEPDDGLRAMNNAEWEDFWTQHLQDVTAPRRVLCGGLITEEEDEDESEDEDEGGNEGEDEGENEGDGEGEGEGEGEEEDEHDDQAHFSEEE
ncbi:hypothetical protein CEP54_000069 [Fusarium duplospermum]|uniref:protein S-acyltransferase n=1 Tax=Fusarium duplospermum TaxID=1325734 RepID=A0A428R8E3_9HYPO|nr:hypothetical protein CEP54_000069 [Fusarium duplospermum]